MRLVRAAERAGAQRFLFFSAIGAEPPLARALLPGQGAGREAVAEAELETTVFAPSIVYAPGDPWITLLERLSLLPAMPDVRAPATRVYQPIWAEDVAACVSARSTGTEQCRERGYRARRPGDAVL